MTGFQAANAKFQRGFQFQAPNNPTAAWNLMVGVCLELALGTRVFRVSGRIG
jgi:hypothetical protein